MGFLQHIAALLLYNILEKTEQKQNSPLSFRTVGTEGGQVHPPIVFGIAVNPTYRPGGQIMPTALLRAPPQDFQTS